MSFRSRSRNVQPIQIRPRSHSSSRIGSSTIVPTTSPYSNPVYSSNRPITSSSSYYSTPSNTSSYATSNSYHNPYGSRETVYNPKGRPSFLDKYNRSGDSYGSASNINGSKYGNTNGSKYGSSNSVYSSPYTSDRYVSPYTSTYDNGVTTASLNLSSYGNGVGSVPKTNSYSKSINLNGSSRYNPSSLKSSNLLNSSSISGSNPNLNSYSTNQSGSSSNAQSLGRSQSLREQERRSRNRNRKGSNNPAIIKRSLSVSSEKSEGYEVRI